MENLMRVGQLAKKTGTNTNTLRYYDKEGLLTPSTESESGYRLYSDQDMVRLIQIQTMKELGFTLAEIKKYLVTLDTPEDMVAALTEHEVAIENRIEVLLESLQTLKALKAEVMQMQTMDFKKYADILVNLQMKNEHYWAIKHMDNDVLDHFRKHFENDEDGALALSKTLSGLQAEVAQYQKEGISPESEQGQNIAKAVMEVMEDITDGDMSLLKKFALSIENITDVEDKFAATYKSQYYFLQAALDAYIKKIEPDALKNDDK